MNSYWSIVGQDAKRQINQLQKIGLTITERILAKSDYYEVATNSAVSASPESERLVILLLVRRVGT